jgi:hypothetical protein
MFVD